MIDSKKLPDEAAVLARYDDKSPAWITSPLGKGTLVLMTSGWTPKESQLARSSKFLPLLYSFLGLDKTAEKQPLTHIVGTRVEYKEGAFKTMDGPGLMTTEKGSHAFNLPTEESELETLPSPLFEGFQDPNQFPQQKSTLAAKKTPEQERQISGRESESQQRLWRCILIGVALFLLLESIYSSIVIHQKTQTLGGNPS